MNKIVWLIFVFLSFGTYGQNTFRGTVTNEDLEPIAYCSIGVIGLKAGTVSDENGNFELILPDGLTREVVFSAIGYLSQTFLSDKLRAHPQVRLSYDTMALDPVVISQKRLKDKVIGQKSRPMLTFSKMFDQAVPTIEQGNIFALSRETILNSYNFYIIPSSKFEQITLKLNVYSVKDQMPDASLLTQNIIYETKTTGWQKIDLTPYDLTYRDVNQLGITLQLVDYRPLPEQDFVFGISAKKSVGEDLLFRYQSQGFWEKSTGVFITNLDVSFANSKSEGKAVLPISGVLSQEDRQTKDLISFYENKERAKKTDYGKDKRGQFLDLKDAKIYYETYGEGEPVVLLHGNNGSISDYYQVIPALSKHFQVIALDTRGQGRSTDLSEGDYTYELFAEDLYNVLQELQLERVTIVGWSDGGNTGLVFTLGHPEMVDKLVTIGANLNPGGVEDYLIERFGIQLEEGKGNRRLLQLMLNHPDISPKQLTKITNQVLVVAGSEDVIKESHTRLIHQAIPGSKLEIIPNAGHYVPFDQPKQLNQVMIEFLQGG